MLFCGHIYITLRCHIKYIIYFIAKCCVFISFKLYFIWLFWIFLHYIFFLNKILIFYIYIHISIYKYIYCIFYVFFLNGKLKGFFLWKSTEKSTSRTEPRTFIYSQHEFTITIIYLPDLIIHVIMHDMLHCIGRCCILFSIVLLKHLD